MTVLFGRLRAPDTFRPTRGFPIHASLLPVDTGADPSGGRLPRKAGLHAPKLARTTLVNLPIAIVVLTVPTAFDFVPLAR
ncbi:MAG: hypothetical protein ACJAYU_001616 [Bradymonadia bacterium]|jgi:hypothetical protein